MSEASEIVFLTIVSKRQKKDELLEMLTKAGGHLIHVMYARSSIRNDCIKELFCMVEDEDKLMITLVLASEQVSQVFDLLNTKFNFNKPDTGIAFTTPVELLSL